MSNRAMTTRFSRPREACDRSRQSGRALLRDARGGVSMEYLVIVSGIALALVAAAVALCDGYANGFVARSFTVLGVE